MTAKERLGLTATGQDEEIAEQDAVQVVLCLQKVARRHRHYQVHPRRFRPEQSHVRQMHWMPSALGRQLAALVPHNACVGGCVAESAVVREKDPDRARWKWLWV